MSRHRTHAALGYAAPESARAPDPAGLQYAAPAQRLAAGWRPARCATDLKADVNRVAGGVIRERVAATALLLLIQRHLGSALPARARRELADPDWGKDRTQQDARPERILSCRTVQTRHHKPRPPPPLPPALTRMGVTSKAWDAAACRGGAMVAGRLHLFSRNAAARPEMPDPITATRLLWGGS